MLSISAFYGIIIYMYFMDNKKHKLPHIQVPSKQSTAKHRFPGCSAVDLPALQRAW
jgi:hypothetical protein